MSAEGDDPASCLRSGDILLMNRRCMKMRDPIGIAICLLNKTECPFDHVAMVMKLNEEQVEQQQQAGTIHPNDPISPSGTYVLETNLSGVTLRALENRLARSSSNSVSVRFLHMGETRDEHEKLLYNHLPRVSNIPYKMDFVGFIPSFFSPPDKMDRIKAAHKLYLLSKEIENINKLLPMMVHKKDDATTLQTLRQTYYEASIFLQDMYFPHLERLKNDNQVPLLNWNEGHFVVDGSNVENGLFCSELIAHLWQTSGIVSEFPPASSFRPFDFLDDTRFNFLISSILWGDIVTLADRRAPTAPVHRRFIEETNTLSKRLEFYRHISNNGNLENGLDSIYKWLIQSNTTRVVHHDLVANIVSMGVLFSMCGLMVAPLRLRWIECQLGVMLLRGSVWSLAAGLLTRDLFSVAVQGLTASIILRCLSYSTHTAPTNTNININKNSDSHSSTVHNGESRVLLGPSLLPPSKYCDTRHPFYTVAAVWLAAGAAAHVAATPILNAVLAQHFGPSTAASSSFSFARRGLLRGAVSLLPLAALLPQQAVWLTWYETAGASIIPTPASPLRQRPDLLQTEEWRHFRHKALLGAFAATTALDAVLYPLQRRCWRSFLAQIYKPAAAPSYGRRLYAGYSYRLAGNLTIMFSSSLSMYLLGVI
ncbi:uncharacterized protein TM35_000041490 [Trypanosoma theileri]|uniref:Uncharacterized protein n=1 Tax=Trypanosoma theileri TaxID=67003 RepID=A0A1X0P4Y6_9TRYP|nr:uncharacterized protein TM35_000041490 [Trypanosoma theileri]ORC91935.1 hypothetical protein TM35_000041490 [Trypanosoma theileri]